MRLLARPDVVQWIRGDTSFLGTFAQKTKTARTKAAKEAEDAWGRALMKEVRPDLNPTQWSNLFGEMICRELYETQGKTVTKPRTLEGQAPDWETEDLILEAKVGTYFTEGTAHEKVLAVPLKYSEVPNRYGKPLHVVCIGRAEQEMFGKYKVDSPECEPVRRKFFELFREFNIIYVSAKSLIDA